MTDGFGSEKIIVAIVAMSLILIVVTSIFPDIGVPTSLPFLILSILVSVITVLAVVTGKFKITDKSGIFVVLVCLAVAGAVLFYAPTFLGSFQPAAIELQSIFSGGVP